MMREQTIFSESITNSELRQTDIIIITSFFFIFYELEWIYKFINASHEDNAVNMHV